MRHFPPSGREKHGRILACPQSPIIYHVGRSQHAPRRRLLLAYPRRFPNKAVGLYVNTGDEEGIQCRMASKAVQVVGSQRQRKDQAKGEKPGV